MKDCCSHWRYYAFAAVMLFLSLCALGQTTTVKDGVLDLSQINLNNEIVDLSGQWKFYQGITEPSQIDSTTYKLIKTPGTWPIGSRAKRFGYGIYHLKAVNCNADHLALKLGVIQAGYRVWIDDRLVGQVGDPSLQNYEPELLSQVITFEGEKNFDLYILVTNYSHRKGGIHGSIYLGEVGKIQRKRETALLTDALLSAIIFAVALYSLVMFSYDLTQTNFLFFALFCISVIIRVIAIDEIIIKIIFPDFPHTLLMHFQYVGFVLSVGFIGLYQQSIFQTRFMTKVSKLFMWVSIATSVALIISPVWANSYISLLFQGFTLIGIGCVYYQFFKILPKADSLLYMLMVGFSLIIVVFIHDILAANGLIKFDYWQVYGFASYAIVQAIYFGAQYRSLHEKVKALHTNLVDYGLIRKRKGEFERELITELRLLGKNIEDEQDRSQLKEIVKKLTNPPELPNVHKVALENLEQFNEDFIFQLQKKYPSLTSSELELCVCLKAKLATKEIAVMRNISPDSVKKARTRLRKKLGLPKETDFTVFFNSI